MSDRNLVYEVLILRSKEIPSGSRVVTLLSAEIGLLDVFIFGGPKSKLRSLASPWCSGRAFIYHDPAKDYYKLSDFEVEESYSGLREGLRRIMSATLVAELLIKTSGGGGDFPEVLALARSCLRGLEGLPELRSDYCLILFIWRLMELAGLLPDTGVCGRCGRKIGETEARTWLQSESAFACQVCRPLAGHSDEAIISAGASRWLERAEGLAFAEALAASLDSSSLSGLKRMAFGLARSAVDSPLEVLEAGIL